MPNTKKILTDKTLEQASRDERLHDTDAELDAIWAKEAEFRIDAYERGEIKAVSMDDVFGKYKKR